MNEPYSQADALKPAALIKTLIDMKEASIKTIEQENAKIASIEESLKLLQQPLQSST